MADAVMTEGGMSDGRDEEIAVHVFDVVLR